MAWFIKTETFRLPRPQLLAHLQAHHAWVADLRQQGVVISSGYLVDQAGRPGGGGSLVAGEGGGGETVTFGDGNRHHGIGAGG